MKDWLLGTDVEFIAIKTIRGKETPFPMEGLLVGTKTEPEYIDSSNQRGVLLDNVCVEYVCKPAGTKEDFVNEQIFMRDYIDTMLSAYRLKLHKETYAYFNNKQLQSENNMEFGCSPAFNPRTKKAYEAPSSSTTLRTASMHLHISLNDQKMTIDDAERMAILLDLYVGVPSVLLQKDRERRKLYGRAGEFRHTPYHGVEYRVLGNEYLFDKSKLEMVYDQTEYAIKQFRDGISLNDDLSYSIEKVINEYDVDSAKELVDKFNLKLQ